MFFLHRLIVQYGFIVVFPWICAMYFEQVHALLLYSINSPLSSPLFKQCLVNFIMLSSYVCVYVYVYICNVLQTCPVPSPGPHSPQCLFMLCSCLIVIHHHYHFRSGFHIWMKTFHTCLSELGLCCSPW
jgi:hypothetical protein